MQKKGLARKQQQDKKEAPVCAKCNEGHSQFFKCPHYKGSKLRAAKFCEKLAEKQSKQKRTQEEEKEPSKQVKFVNEIDVLPFVPQHIVTIDGVLQKHEYSPYKASTKEKTLLWKQVMAGLEKYRGLTITCPGVVDALNIEFGEEGVHINKKVFRVKLAQLARDDVAKGVDARKKTADVKEAAVEAVQEAQVEINFPKEVINLKQQVAGYEAHFEQYTAQFNKDFDFLRSEWKKVDQDMLEKDTYQQRMTWKLQAEGEKIHARLDKQVEMYQQLFRKDTDKNNRIYQLDDSVQACTAACKDFEKRGNELIGNMQTATSQFIKYADRFKKGAKKYNALIHNQNVFIKTLKTVQYRLDCQEQNFSMPQFVSNMIDTVVAGESYLYANDLASCLE